MKIWSILIYLIFLSACSSTGVETETNVKQNEENNYIKIMTFNMWHGGDAGKQPILKSIETIRKAEAGIVGAQESHGYGNPRPDNSEQMAVNMGWRHVDQGHFDAVMTKYQAAEITSDKKAIKIKIDDEKYLWIVNCHLMYIPYQPYQINNKKYGDYPFISTEQEAIEWANKARKSEVDAVVKVVKEVLNEGWPVIVTGDFNEPSHLDWTDNAAKNGICKTKVEWPSTKAFTDIGMKDAYREFRKDEVEFPGKTWSSIDSPGEIHDRIDFIFFIGDQLKLIKTEVVGESSDGADIFVENYPSDHRAVVATFQWE